MRKCHTGFKPTPQQVRIIEHKGSAFVSACPGAGKTYCIVERARAVLSKSKDGRGLAFLSFTNAAVSELQERLASNRLLPIPVFPHFVGTFDSFIWHYLVEPFGLDGCNGPLRLIPDTDDLLVTPFPGAQALKLECFERATGQIIPAEAIKVRFDRDPQRYETAAQRLRVGLLANGYLDFEDVRRIANANLQNKEFSARLGDILSARFSEIIVDEAQDCNPDDLSIIDWLRKKAMVPTIVVCDPHQSIYGFRGGVSDELFKYVDSFPADEKLSLTGNFRSSRHICKVVHTLRAPRRRGDEDEALGKLKDCTVNVQVLSYKGQGVSTDIGAAFGVITAAQGIDLKDCRLTAKTRKSGLKAIQAYTEEVGQSLSLRLADAVMKFHHAETQKEQINAIRETHIVALTVSGKLIDRTYHQVLAEDELDDLSWRGQIMQIIRSLHYDPAEGHTPDRWIGRARAALGPLLPPGTGTINLKLRNEARLDEILEASPTPHLSAQTIHEVKGRQFPGICVVLTTSKAKGILTHLEKEPDQSKAEDARELYVAASRAQKLLVIACPKSQSARLVKHISSSGAGIDVTEI